MKIRTVRSLIVGNVLLPEHVSYAKATREKQGLPSNMMEKKLAKIEQKKGGLDQPQSARESEHQSARRFKRQSARKNQWEAAEERTQKSIQRPNMFDKEPKNEDREPNNSGEHGIAVSKNCCGEGSEQNDCCTGSDTKHSSAKSESARGVGLRESARLAQTIAEEFAVPSEFHDETRYWETIRMAYIILYVISCVAFVFLSYRHSTYATRIQMGGRFVSNLLPGFLEAVAACNATCEQPLCPTPPCCLCLFKLKKYPRASYSMCWIVPIHFCFFTSLCTATIVNCRDAEKRLKSSQNPHNQTVFEVERGFSIYYVIAYVFQCVMVVLMGWSWPSWEPIESKEPNGERDEDLSFLSIV